MEPNTIQILENFPKYSWDISFKHKLTDLDCSYNQISELDHLLFKMNELNYHSNPLVKLTYPKQSLPDIWPNTITHLTLSCFEKPLTFLPINITHLFLGLFYNQPLDNLPNTLVMLVVSWIFSQSFDNLPKYLTYLKLPEKYDYPINNLPYNITYLGLPLNYNHTINKLPDTLIHLTLENDDIKSLIKDIIKPSIKIDYRIPINIV